MALASCVGLETPAVSVGMQSAIAVVTRQVLPDVVPPGTSYVCLRLDNPLPPGSVIEEDAPVGQTAVQAFSSSQVLASGGESFFFFLDLDPGALYEHPVKYIVVDRNGSYQVMNANWWPRINGEIPKPISVQTPDPAHVIAGNITLTPPTGTLMEFEFDMAQRDLVHRPGEGFIVVQGLLPDENLFDCATNTFRNALAFFSAYKNELSEITGLVEGDALDVFDEIDRMVAAGLNPITIFIIAHGSVEKLRLGGFWRFASQFRFKMATHPNTEFNFLLGSCHGGSFVDDLSALSNVRVIKTASAPIGSAYPDWDNVSGEVDYNPDDSGSEWTSSLLRAAELIVGSPKSWTRVQSIASSRNVPVTSVLLDIAGYGALGEYSSLGLSQDLDLSHRIGSTEPQHYRSWIQLILIGQTDRRP